MSRAINQTEFSVVDEIKLTSLPGQSGGDIRASYTTLAQRARYQDPKVTIGGMIGLAGYQVEQCAVKLLAQQLPTFGNCLQFQWLRNLEWVPVGKEYDMVSGRSTPEWFIEIVYGGSACRARHRTVMKKFNKILNMQWSGHSNIMFMVDRAAFSKYREPRRGPLTVCPTTNFRILLPKICNSVRLSKQIVELCMPEEELFSWATKNCKEEDYFVWKEVLEGEWDHDRREFVSSQGDDRNLVSESQESDQAESSPHSGSNLGHIGDLLWGLCERGDLVVP